MAATHLLPLDNSTLTRRNMLTVAEAASLACRRPMTIHRWIRAGLLPVADRDRRGRLLVEWDAVLRVERDTRARDTTGRSAEAIDRA